MGLNWKEIAEVVWIKAQEEAEPFYEEEEDLPRTYTVVMPEEEGYTQEEIREELARFEV